MTEPRPLGFEREVLDRLIRIESRQQSLTDLVASIAIDLDGNGDRGIKHRLAVLETQVHERTRPRVEPALIGGGSAAVVVGLSELLRALGWLTT